MAPTAGCGVRMVTAMKSEAVAKATDDTLIHRSKRGKPPDWWPWRPNRSRCSSSSPRSMGRRNLATPGSASPAYAIAKSIAVIR